MNPIQTLDAYKNNYTNTEIIIYNWMKSQPSEVIHLPIEDIAKETKTSKAAIIRLCKKIGYNGFAEFKFELTRFIISGMEEKADSSSMDVITSISSLYSGFIKQIHDYIKLEDVNHFVEELKNANRIKIIGNNRTGLSAMQMRYRMSKIGLDAEAITDMVLVTSIQDTFKKGDVIILFSIYARTKTYDEFIKTVATSDATIVLITMTEKSVYKKYCDYIFLLPCISKASSTSFLDDQTIFFVFIEIILARLASK